MTERLQPGAPAPDFTLPDADGKPVSLSDFRGRRVIVYFYPAAGTPGCTTEACDFRDNLAELNDAGVDVLGISPDKPAKLAKFRDAEGLTFPLLSDVDRQALTAWGAFGDGRDPLDVPGRPRRTDRGGAVQRPGDGARGEAAEGPEGLSA